MTTRGSGDGDDLIRLLAQHPEGQTVHILERGASVERLGHLLVVRGPEKIDARIPIGEVGQVVIHGDAQITTPALHACAERGIGIHWVTYGGTLVGSLAPSAPSAQRHLRQFKALMDEERALGLARRLVIAKLQTQLGYLLRSTRGLDRRSDEVDHLCGRIRDALRRAAHAPVADVLLGHEATGTAAYLEGLRLMLAPDLDERLRCDDRTHQPARDRIATILDFAHGMLYREVLQAIVAVGLHPGVGFYHRSRSTAHPLALDLMELFRVAMADMAMIPAINRRTFDPAGDFRELSGRVVLSNTGRRKVVEIIERRKADTWRHDAIGCSLSYGRLIELEVRFLEKEWVGQGGLFATITPEHHHHA